MKEDSVPGALRKTMFFSVEHPWTSLLDGVQDSCCCQSLLCSHCLNIHVLLYVVLNRAVRHVMTNLTIHITEKGIIIRISQHS